jgi:hypothetical protein
MRKRRALALRALVLATLATGPALAAEPELQSMCAQMASWTPKQLQELKDVDLEKFTCISAKATLRATMTRDGAAEANCRTGMKKLLEEFKRRWPGREPSEVTGKC